MRAGRPLARIGPARPGSRASNSRDRAYETPQNMDVKQGLALRHASHLSIAYGARALRKIPGLLICLLVPRKGEVSESGVEAVSLHICEDRPPDCFTQLDGHCVANLTIHILDVPPKDPVVRKTLDASILLDRQRSVLRRVAKIRRRHRWARNQRGARSVKTKTTIKPRLPSRKMVCLAHGSLLHVGRKVPPVLSFAKHPEVHEPLFRKLLIPLGLFLKVPHRLAKRHPWSKSPAGHI